MILKVLLAPNCVPGYHFAKVYIRSVQQIMYECCVVDFFVKAMSHGAKFSCNLQPNCTVEKCKLDKYASSLHFANVFFKYQTVFTN